ncbi:MAG: prepilin-type N-terminal cleavage/methylation domain-containing protein [Myxococcales bacterium]|nr:prepilin-type N-terminal cleavage/methylation domain-containing protein [Myxococcales bacterium]
MCRDARASQRGFTLIELMVTLAVLVAVASVAFAGFRRNEQTTQTKRFVAAVHGAIIQARNRAIDDQTPVHVDVTASTMSLSAFNNVTGVWDLFEVVHMTHQGGMLLDDDVVCIFGLDTGVQTPAQAVASGPPAGCLEISQRLRFEPDGTFSDPDNTFSTVPNAGVTLWIGDRTVPGEVEYSIVQVFPGGLIRTIEGLT